MSRVRWALMIDGVPVTLDATVSRIDPAVREEAAKVLSAVVDVLRPPRAKRLPLRERMAQLPAPVGLEGVNRQLDVLCEYARGAR